MDYSFQETLPQNRFAHTVLVGQVTDSSGVFKRCFISTHTVDSAIYSVSYGNNDEYKNTALAPLEAIFRPFSTNTSTSGIPHFESPENSAPHPNVNDYNIFGSGMGYSDIDYALSGDSITNGKTISTRDSDFEYTNIRSICLKGPLVIAGWGWDTKGKPVPNEDEASPTENFLNDYRQRTDMWKTGPLDTRWDYKRKVWVAGSPRILGVVVKHDGYSINNLPQYIVRLATGYSSGCIEYDDATFPGSGLDDYTVFNIQEAVGDNHTIGVHSAVMLEEVFGEYLINEHVRTLIRRS